MAVNYQKLMDTELAGITADAPPPKLLLHACCAPCSSYVLEYTAKFFDITVLFYNPNIMPAEEYYKRLGEMEKLLTAAEYPNPVKLVPDRYDPAEFIAAASGFESEPEGGARCGKCFELRLCRTAELAAEGGFDYFATTLTVSPHKNAEEINTVGARLGEQYGVRWLPSDFKKRGGYQRSIVLSREYGLYRQNYCGCPYAQNTSGETGTQVV